MHSITSTDEAKTTQGDNLKSLSSVGTSHAAATSEASRRDTVPMNPYLDEDIADILAYQPVRTCPQLKALETQA